MFTIQFGVGKSHTTKTDDLYSAVMIADALVAKGWLRVLVTGPDGNFVPWRTLTAR